MIYYPRPMIGHGGVECNTRRTMPHVSHMSTRFIYCDASIRSGVIGLGVYERGSGVMVPAKVDGIHGARDTTYAEILGILLAIRIHSSQSEEHEALHVFTDSLAAMQTIKHGARAMYHDVTDQRKIKKTKEKYEPVLDALKTATHETNAPVWIWKVRAHSGVSGNVAADTLAYMGTQHTHCHDDVRMPLLTSGSVEARWPVSDVNGYHFAKVLKKRQNGGGSAIGQ